MLQELRRFSTDERGAGDPVVYLVMAGIAIVLAVTLFKGVIGNYLKTDTVPKILCWLRCALTQDCTSC
jgi:hypothetical protein